MKPCLISTTPCPGKKWLKRILFLLTGLWLVTIVIYWFNLDNKFLYYVVHPFLKKHYDKIERDRRL